MVKYEEIAWALSPYITDSDTLLRAVDRLVYVFPNPTPLTTPNGMVTWDGSQWTFNHDKIVEMVLASSDVMRELRGGRKINAIKLVRYFTGCGLVAAKSAVEDGRVAEALI